MEDNIGLFKILVVVLVVGYQIVKALQKKATGAAIPGPVATEQPESSPEPELSPWGQDTSPKQAQAESMRERIRTLVLGRVEAHPPAPVAAMAPPPEVRPALEAPIAALSGSQANAPLVVPQIREMLLSQVVLGRPLGLRGLGLTRRSPADLRP